MREKKKTKNFSKESKSDSSFCYQANFSYDKFDFLNNTVYNICSILYV